MRVPFSQVFRMNSNGTVTPIVTVRLGPATMSANSASISPDAVSFGGPKISEFLGKDLDVEVEGDVYIIKRYFK
jgi:hypothetical protein